MMLKDHRRELSSIYRFLDFAIIVIAVNAVFYIYYNTTILDFAALPFQCQIFLAVISLPGFISPTAFVCTHPEE